MTQLLEFNIAFDPQDNYLTLECNQVFVVFGKEALMHNRNRNAGGMVYSLRSAVYNLRGTRNTAGHHYPQSSGQVSGRASGIVNVCFLIATIATVQNLRPRNRQQQQRPVEGETSREIHRGDGYEQRSGSGSMPRSHMNHGSPTTGTAPRGTIVEPTPANPDVESAERLLPGNESSSNAANTG